MTSAGQPAAPSNDPDSCPIRLGAARNRAMRETHALLDLIEELLPTLHDEHVMWILGCTRDLARRRAYDP